MIKAEVFSWPTYFVWFGKNKIKIPKSAEDLWRIDEGQKKDEKFC